MLFRSQWYYSRWDVPALGDLGGRGSKGLLGVEQLTQVLSQDSYIGADNPSSRSPELVENINAFEDWLFNHPFVQYDEYSPEVLEKQYDAAEGDEKSELGWRIINQFDPAHDFMIDLMILYADQRLPFKRESEEYQFIENMINSYGRFLDEVPDPFGVEAFEKLQKDIEAAQRERENNPEWQRRKRGAEAVDKTMAELQEKLRAYDESRGVKRGQQREKASGFMPSPSDASVPDGIDSSLLDENLKELSPPKVFSTEATLPVSKTAEDTLENDGNFTDESDSAPGEPLSPERFDKAQQLIKQFGAEEELRHLRESDPEAARRFEQVRLEQERRGAPSRDAPRGHTPPDDQQPDGSP